MSVFDAFQSQAWPFTFAAELQFIDQVRGGTPTDPRVIDGWLKSKTMSKDDAIREDIAKAVLERQVTASEALKEIGDARHLSGFKKDEIGLYIEGRQIKAAIKEAANICVAADKVSYRGWGSTKKSLLSFTAEHVVVSDLRVHLMRDGKPIGEPDGIAQDFVHTFNGNGIHYSEYVLQPTISFTVRSDWDFPDKHWAIVWLTGEQQGIGAQRSQSYGRYQVTKWDKI